ncbi:MAG TPA: CHASE3 domain-containing protein [Candidatus Sulfotelmatobacter sp.]|nr:CHASE3 domain-containing protein [Candidatus Sulfotelmatobacter sp.]
MAIFKLLSAETWVMHTRDVQVALERVNTLFSRAGRARSEYVTSHDPSRLADFQSAIQLIPPELAQVKGLTSDNASQQENFKELAGLSDRRLQMLQAAVAAAQDPKTPIGAQALSNQAIVGIGAEMDRLIQQMQNQEQSLLDVRAERKRHSEKLVAVLLAVTFLIAGALFVLDYRLLNSELRERRRAQASLQMLSARILRLQDEERRRFSRDLHDSMGQLLVSIKMQLDLLALSMADNATLINCSALLDQALRETRTISHLLHPPLLDQAGFESAAREYAEGFSKRSGIPVAFEATGAVERLAPLLETTLFRLLQEGLTNIHKHAASSKVDIRVAFEPAQVTLAISDDGKGMPVGILDSFHHDGVRLGVGLAGMKERVRELGGHIEIESDSKGTRIVAVLPRAPLRPPAVPDIATPAREKSDPIAPLDLTTDPSTGTAEG